MLFTVGDAVMNVDCMLPWGHMAVGYVVYSLGSRVRYDGPPDGAAIIALVIATQLPDLIDKPLTTWFGVLPTGRSLGHSLLFVLVAGMIVWLLTRHVDRPQIVEGFVVGHLSHVVADAIDPIWGGRWEELGYLFWPLTAAYEYPSDDDRIFTEYLLVQLISAPHHELAMFVIAVLLWLYDGMPGTNEVRRSVRCHKDNG